jgi:hypothetical protein
VKYSLSHLSDQTLLHGLAALVARDRANTAELLAHLAEVDERRLYLPAGYPSMFAYCVQELGLCEQAAYYRIRAARTARQFPAIFSAVAERRLHLSTIVLLAPHLTAVNAEQLLSAATSKSKSEVERFLAERFPRPDLPAHVRPVSFQARCNDPAGSLGLIQHRRRRNKPKLEMHHRRRARWSRPLRQSQPSGNYPRG